MRICVLGGTGYIGSALIHQFSALGHNLLIIVRTKEKASTVEGKGLEARWIDGGFSNLTAVVSAVAECDAVIDVAAHNFQEQAPVMEAIRRALGAGKVFISTTGMFFYGDKPESKATPLSEDAPCGFPFDQDGFWSRFEASVLDGAAEGLRTCIVRPPYVYGNGGGGIGGGILGTKGTARHLGYSPWVDDGRGGVTSTVHVDDLADLYALVLKALASGELSPGSVVNAASGQISHQKRAEAVALSCGGLPVVKVDVAEAAKSLGPFELFRETHTIVTSSLKARNLGWEPWRPSLAEDLEHGSYSDGSKADQPAQL